MIVLSPRRRLRLLVATLLASFLVKTLAKLVALVKQRARQVGRVSLNVSKDVKLGARQELAKRHAKQGQLVKMLAS